MITTTTDDGQEWVSITPDEIVDEEPPHDPETLDRQQIEALSAELREIEAIERGSTLIEDRDTLRARLDRKVEVSRELLVVKLSRRARRDRLATIGARATEIARRRERVAFLQSELPRASALDARTDIQQPQRPRAEVLQERIARHLAEVERLEAGGEVHGMIDAMSPAIGTPRR